MVQPLLLDAVEVELPSATRIASDSPFGSVGVVGIYRPPANTGWSI